MAKFRRNRRENNVEDLKLIFEASDFKITIQKVNFKNLIDFFYQISIKDNYHMKHIRININNMSHVQAD